ncbi:MAG TPA: hypothetical protein VJ583_11495 [Nitrososphaeraceae archaeon]|nr:hypothetical protein [Nitrososphaeraceae archaeon]
MGPDSYVVTETPNESVETDLATLRMQLGTDYTITGPIKIFTGDCASNVDDGIGTIGAGESQTCNIINSFTIRGSL